MHSAFVFPLGNCVILRHCIKWRNNSRLRSQETASCSLTLCCQCVCEQAHREIWRHSSFRKAATRLGFEPCTSLFTLRAALFRWIPLYGNCKWWWQFCSWFGSSVMWRCIARWVPVGVSSGCSTFIFRVNNPRDSWRCIHYDASKRREIHGVTLQKTRILSNTAVRTCLHGCVGCLAGVCTLYVGRMTAGSIFVCLFVRLFVWASDSCLSDLQCHKVAGQYIQMSLCQYRDCTHVQSNTVLCTQQYLGNVNFGLNMVDNSLNNFCNCCWWLMVNKIAFPGT